jgi:hypothetical protein
MKRKGGRNLAAELKSAGYTADVIAYGLTLVGIDEERAKAILLAAGFTSRAAEWGWMAAQATKRIEQEFR